MTTNEIAGRLVELCRKGDFETAQSELFADDVVSIEPHATPDFDKETKGKNAVHEKIKKWNAMVQTHSVTVSEPLIAPNAFACTMQMKVTIQGKGDMELTELCVYKVKDGKIIEEQFYM